MILNCIIIDDEPLAADLLASYVKKTPYLNLVGTFNGAIDAIRVIREKSVDLCFLDIQMPELSGLELAKLLPEETKIVFTTAFSQYAVDGYKYNAVDYLVKPISYEDFVSACLRVLRGNDEPRRDVDVTERIVYVKSDYKLIQVLLDELLYVEGEKDYVKFFIEGRDEPIMSLLSMKTIEERLPKPEFLRTHRSFIVNTSKSKVIDKGHFIVGEVRIPVSESYKAEVAKYIDSHVLS